MFLGHMILVYMLMVKSTGSTVYCLYSKHRGDVTVTTYNEKDSEIFSEYIYLHICLDNTTIYTSLSFKVYTQLCFCFVVVSLCACGT